ncbi:MAG: hypothetical protein KBF17_03900 [Candidatus Promineofilum sp.]|nr:hypothetical protein [Promineifilum sp.]MBP9656747.1 hypothetical protein [Promineifilum sp.]
MDTSTRQEILQLLADGKITAAEAIELLDNKAAQAVEKAPVAETIEALKAGENVQPTTGEIPVEELKESEVVSLKINRDDIIPSAKDGPRPRWLKIRVSELDSGRGRVNINIPIGIVNFGLGIASRFGGDNADLAQAGELWQMVKNGERGVLVDVEDEEDNEHVQILLD